MQVFAKNREGFGFSRVVPSNGHFKGAVMNVRNLVFLVACLILAIGLGVVLGKNSEAQKQTLSIKTYDVPIDKAEEIRRTLSHLFTNDHTDGSSQIFGNGSLVVKASESYQQGIAQLIDRLSKEKATARSVRFDYWMVRSEPQAVPANPGLDPLQTILGTITQSSGTKNFTLLEHLAFSTLNGRDVRIKGAMSEVKAKPFVRGDSLDVELKLNSRAALGEVESSINMKSGEFIVVGQTIMQPNANALAEDKVPGSNSKDVFHIIRAEVLP
jgi:hypothetical protein